jgi:hypothetical protein
MWIEFNNKKFKVDTNPLSIYNSPDEGCEVMVTDGYSEAIMWYIKSSTYEWFCDNENDPDNPLTGDELPFQPTHWMTIEDYKTHRRNIVINAIILYE